MKRWLGSLAVTVGALSALILALNVMTGRLGEFIRTLAHEWHEAKSSPDVNEMAGDMAQLAGIAWRAIELISWQTWASLIFVIMVGSGAWHYLVALPRRREKDRVLRRLTKKKATSEGLEAEDSADDP